MTSSRGDLLRRSGLRAPSPGPISTMQSSSAGWIASTIFSRIHGSWRKFWPNRLRGVCELDGKLERLEQAAGVGLAGACEIERRAVVHRRAHERQAERDIHA